MLSEVEKLSSITGALNANEAGLGKIAFPSDQSLKLECSRTVKAQQYSVQQLMDLLSRDLLKLSHETTLAVSALKRRTDNTLKSDMFTKLKSDIQSFMNDINTSFKKTESNLTSSVISTVDNVKASVQILSNNVSETILTLQQQTRDLIQEECVDYVNVSIADVMKNTNITLEDLRSAVLGTMSDISNDITELKRVQIPDLVQENNAKIYSLGDRVTFSNKKVDHMGLWMQGNITEVKSWTENISESTKIDVWRNLSLMNESFSENIGELKETTDQKLLTLAVNTDDEISILHDTDETIIELLQNLTLTIHMNMSSFADNHSTVKSPCILSIFFYDRNIVV